MTSLALVQQVPPAAMIWNLPRRGQHCLAGPAAGRSEQRELISTSGLEGFCQLVSELGGDWSTLLAHCGIPAGALDNPEDKIPFAAVACLFETAAVVLDCPDFGMRFTKRQNALSVMKPLDRLVCNAPTLGKAIAAASTHMMAYSGMMRETLEYDADRDLFRLRYDTRLNNMPSTPQLAERSLLLIRNSVMQLTNNAVQPREVWFAHRRISPLPTYRAMFDTNVLFGQEVDAVFFSGDDLRQRIVGSNVEVFESEQRLAQEAFPSLRSDFETAVRDFLRDNLDKPNASRKDLAEYLDYSVRTLHRKLSAAGWTFETIRDDVRRSLALRYLARVDISLTEAAALLGYSELAVFSRSCQRWFSAPPGALRRTRQATAGSQQ